MLRINFKKIMTTEKIYIGNGKAVSPSYPNLNSVSINMTKAFASGLIFEHEGKKYLKFIVAERKEADKFGRTLTVFVESKVETAVEAELQDNSQEVLANDDLPF